jgi:hypothetical protein
MWFGRSEGVCEGNPLAKFQGANDAGIFTSSGDIGAQFDQSQNGIGLHYPNPRLMLAEKLGPSGSSDAPQTADVGQKHAIAREMG